MIPSDAPSVRQEFSLAHLTVLGLAPPEMIYVAARAGYDYVSLRPICMGLPDEPNYALAEQPQLLARTKTALADTGVRLHDIELARIFEGVDVRSYLPALEVGAELGARAVLSSMMLASVPELQNRTRSSAGKRATSISLSWVSQRLGAPSTMPLSSAWTTAARITGSECP